MSLVRFKNDPLFTDAFPFLIDNFFGKDMANTGFSRNHVPAVNIRETSEDFQLEVAAPGLKKEDFKVTLEKNILTISSERELAEETKEGRYSRKEFGYQSFKRSFTLPELVDKNSIQARYTDGVLYLAIPKLEEAKDKGPRQISIA